MMLTHFDCIGIRFVFVFEFELPSKYGMLLMFISYANNRNYDYYHDETWDEMNLCIVRLTMAQID